MMLTRVVLLTLMVAATLAVVPSPASAATRVVYVDVAVHPTWPVGSAVALTGRSRRGRSPGRNATGWR